MSIISVSIPLALLILSNDAAIGIGALEQRGRSNGKNISDRRFSHSILAMPHAKKENVGRYGKDY
jgi:hypothetical protein